MSLTDLLLHGGLGLDLVGLAVRLTALLVVPVNRRPSSATAWLLAIFLVPYLGLMAFPMIIGWVLNKVNPGVGEAIKAGEHVSYNYTVPMLIFASLGVLAFLLAFWLKLEDRKKHYGLELPNIKK